MTTHTGKHTVDSFKGISFLKKTMTSSHRPYTVTGKTVCNLAAEVQTTIAARGVFFVVLAFQGLLAILLQKRLSLCHLQKHRRQMLRDKHFLFSNLSQAPTRKATRRRTRGELC